MPTVSDATRRPLPIILIRGFGGLSTEDERRIAYQGFNDGSVYPHKQGENYIYEGFILRLIKTDFAYGDATNVVGYFDRVDRVRHEDEALADVPPPLRAYFRDGKIVADPEMTRRLLRDPARLAKTFWVFRYYDLGDRNFAEYGKALKRLIDIVRTFCAVGGVPPKVNIVAHSMGGLIVRETVQSAYGAGKAAEAINKIVTLGTPHRGISFQVLRDLRWLPFLDAADELEQFNPAKAGAKSNPRAYEKFGKAFPLERMLCVVGTDYRSYSVGISSLANRLFSVSGEFGANYNRSDGLVKQTNAMIEGAQRTFVHKCHGGGDSLMTARESFEVATRFFFGDLRVRVFLADAKVKRKLDMFGKSEIFFGLSIKPRRLDFDLFHQSEHAENCYGPFAKRDLSDKGVAFDWAGPGRLIWEGFLNSGLRFDPDVVLRAEVYVGERDLHGFGFSDNLIFRKQYFVRALLTPKLTLEWHVDQNFQKKTAQGQERRFPKREMPVADGGWEFPIGDDNSFDGRLRVELDWIPEEGAPQPLAPGATFDLAPTDSQQAMVITKIVS